ncbi:glutamine synthetase family protein [Pseudogracilibacillus auburnensis]|uniref:Glutamine synthetase n=1 Tax=Pseudogracilibacillus auburnensis TaxID=1494959 RepID=A0A2V3W4J7_9BACI|nr:glutamine synthetase family protein [Pseudogracilibacillus auburnensis]PXW88104.1 glutamine synthetase [Pseudogracilibacillus auburnensis]
MDTTRCLEIENILKLVEENNIEFIRVEFLDYSNVTRGRTIRKSNLREAMEKGVNFSTAIMSFDVFDTYIPDPMYGAEDGDFFALPDPQTFAILPHRKNTARMLCDLVDENGNLWKGCPRGALKRLLNKVEQVLGGTLHMAYEQEAYLLKEVDGNRVTADNSHCFSSVGVDIQERFVQDFVFTLEEMGVTTEQISSEYGPGQLEINLKYTNALKATDDQVTFAHTFKQIARDHDMIGTLMPKPFSHLAGSGLHTHISLFNEHGENLFKEITDQKGLDMSEEAYYFIGGLLKHGKSLIAIGAPSYNSYKRMLPGSWAPAHICYGTANRSVLVRILEKRRERRFEFRGADGTCNPYLLSTCLIAAGLDGIQNKIDPGDPILEDVSQMDEFERKEKGIEWVPRTLSDALDSLAEDTILADTIGREIWTEFIKVKRNEWNKFCQYVTDNELKLYSDMY